MFESGYFPAIIAISTLTSRGSRATSTVARAGGLLLKNSAHTDSFSRNRSIYEFIIVVGYVFLEEPSEE
jgi:hypothetical protein